jgi:UDP-glucuronate 4-epimerase
MKILITGVAGFVGSHLASLLAEQGNEVHGLDNLSSYYSPDLKKLRLSKLLEPKNIKFLNLDLVDGKPLRQLLEKDDYESVIHLAAQPGVRTPLNRSNEYIENNVQAFTNVLQLVTELETPNFLYASSSSVYGNSKEIPYSESSEDIHPVSIYGATKRANELLAPAYVRQSKTRARGLRFFTVYGPWGRPDMALFKFVKNIFNNKKIKVYNKGDHIRYFTYIDDVTDGIIKIFNLNLKKDLNFNLKNPSPSSSICPWRIYNIGSNNKIKLIEFISIIEKILKKKAKIQYFPLQKGDVETTYANVNKIKYDAKYSPKTDVYKGVSKFINWYLTYYNYK